MVRKYLPSKKYNPLGFIIGIFFFIAMLFIVSAYSFLFSPEEIMILWLLVFVFVITIFYLSVSW